MNCKTEQPEMQIIIEFCLVIQEQNRAICFYSFVVLQDD